VQLAATLSSWQQVNGLKTCHSLGLREKQALTLGVSQALHLDALRPVGGGAE
jgi:hypothetical protein